MKTYICNNCGVEKEIDKFPKDKKAKGGFSKICKECKRKRYHEAKKRKDNDYSYCKYCRTWFKGEGDACSKECEEHRKEMKKEYTCKNCGKKFDYKHNTNNYFCSRECADDYISENGKEEFLNYKYTECNYCNEEIKYLDKKPDYCSYECKAKDNPKECQYCGKEFIDLLGTNKKYCSDDCKNNEYLERAKKRYVSVAKDVKKECEYCGKKFIYNTGETSHRTYCDDCSEKIRGIRKKEQRQRRRARLKNVRVEKFNIKYIFERDNWICQICGEPVDPSLEYPNLMSASIDHIVPLANGGNHTKRNVQLAHFICNSHKGTGGTDQLRLFG